MDVNYSLISVVREGRLERARELIDSYGLSHSPAWSEGYVLLCDALENGHAAVAELLLASGSKVKIKNKKPSNSPLHFAAIIGDLEIVKRLLDNGANINDKNQDDITPLHNAIKNKKLEVTKLLLDHRADVNATDKYGTSLLHVAAQIGGSQMVQLLLKYGAYVDVKLVDDGISPLHIAAQNGNVRVAEVILNHGACINSVTLKEEHSPLHVASKLGYEEVVKLFLNRGADVNAITKDNLSPLHIATRNEHKAVVKLLLEHGGNVNSQDKDGKTILHLAVERNNLFIAKDVLKFYPDINNQSNKNSLKIALHNHRGSIMIVDALLKYGFIVDPEDANDPKSLHAAVANDYYKIVAYLLKYGADVNTLCNSTFNGFTPLHSAAKNKREEVAKLLISYGAHLNAQDKTGKTPLYYAIENADLKITELLLTSKASVKDFPELLNTAIRIDCLEIVEALLQHDADVNATDESGSTALHFSAEAENASNIYLRGLLNYPLVTDYSDFSTYKDPYAKIKKKIAKLLLSKGANVNAKKKNGFTALHVAVQTNHKSVVKVLLECGANVDSRDEDGRTALHIATQKGYFNLVEILLEYGSDINITCKRNYTPLDLAEAGIESFNSNFDYYSDGHYEFNRDVYPRFELIADTIYRHIGKMKTANIFVSEKNLRSLSRNGENNHFQKCCEKEIALMKSEMINNAIISFYDILTKRPSSLAVYMRNENILRVITSGKYEKKFPIYASVIKRQCRMGMERNELLEQGNTIFQFPLNKYPELPYECTEKIFSYLSNADIRILIHASKPLHIINTNTINVGNTSNIKGDE